MSGFNPRSNEGRPEDEAAEKAALLAKRDAILESLRTQFATKVSLIQLRGRTILEPFLAGPELEAFLLDLANNLAQVLS